MLNNSTAFQDAVARAKEIAQKLTANVQNVPVKRPNTDDDQSSKRPALSSGSQIGDIPASVLRAQQIAQQINSQLGVKTPCLDPVSSELTFQENYKVPDKFVGLIIGKGGEQIIRLQAESGCKVQICQTRPEPATGGPNPPDRLATLCGTKEAIARARKIMDDILARGKMSEGAPVGISPYSMAGTNIVSIDVMLPSAKCGLVIGKGGDNIKRVSEEFNVKMYVAQETKEIDGIEHKPLKMTGEADRVERAKQHILDLLAKSNNFSMPNRLSTNPSSTTSYNSYGSRTGGAPTTGPCNEATYHAPHDKAGIIIGKGGESIKEINRKSGAFVELDKTYVPAVGKSSDRVFKLRGTPEQIVTAQQLMYEKIINSPGGPGDVLTPLQFQQQFNLPLVGTNPTDPYGTTNDPYATSANGNDPYSQWANAYAQWPQMNPYDSTSNKDSSSSSTDASSMSQMDPAWMAYYQSMSYYNMMQTPMTDSTSSTTKSTDVANNNNNNNNTDAVNTTTGQADYSQQWIEYYRSVGQNDIADQLAKQIKSGSTATAESNTTTDNPWASYAQHYNNGTNGSSATARVTSNGNNSSADSSS